MSSYSHKLIWEGFRQSVQIKKKLHYVIEIYINFSNFSIIEQFFLLLKPEILKGKQKPNYLTFAEVF